ncbi:MAG: histidine phosphatase family protein, partial [Pseudomonadota bacterium]
MELVLWRHAEAEESADDAARRLTAKGVRQAHRMAAWLNTRLSKDATMIVSPAQRARETALALSRKSVIQQLVSTGARP